MTIKTKTTGIAEYGQHMKALFCGNPGAGKTLTSSTFPNPYYISAEGGLMSIARRFLPFHELESTDELREILKALRQDRNVRGNLLGVNGPIDTIVVDTIDEVQKIFIRERLGAEKGSDATLKLQDYGWLAEKLEGVIRAFRNLDMNVVFTCHMKETTDEDSGITSFKPGLVGRTVEYLPASCDLNFALLTRTETVVEDGKANKRIVRYMQTYGDQKFPWVKDRSGRLPMEFPINFTDDYQRLFDAIYGGIDEEFKALGKAHDLKPNDGPGPVIVGAARAALEIKPTDGPDPDPKAKTTEKKPDPLKTKDQQSEKDFEQFAGTLQA